MASNNPGSDTSGVSHSFREQGYYLAEGVFAGEALARLEDEFDRIVHALQDSGEDVNARWDSANTDALDGGSSRILHTHNVQRFSAHWARALQDDHFLDIAACILGEDIILHHSKLFLKPPEEGAPFPIHQDWWYFPTGKDSMIAAVIFLSDSGGDAGGFRVFPGSHRLGRRENTSGLYPSELLDQHPMSASTPVNAKAGDVLFFSYFTLHGSTPNVSSKPRKTVLVQMYSGDDWLEPNEEVNHVNEQLCLRGWNHHMTREGARK